jgi:regulator of protease activity HflC (stomatin/prohibitin superfamily)
MASPRPFENVGASLIKRVIAFVVVLVLPIVVLSCCTTRIDAAHVGIRVKLAGSSRGVDDIPVVTGWVFYNPLSEQIVAFPTSVQNVTWTKDVHEGAARDESITFSSKEGVNINSDVGLSFHIEPTMAPHLYLKFRKPNLLDLADGYIRNALREAFNITASEMSVQDIYGSQKGKLVADATKRLTEQLGKDGIVIDQLTINGALRLPDNVAQAINRAMEATQQSIQAENRVRQVKAEAEQEVAKAEGEATAARARARGEADAQLIRAKAEARANLILRHSMSPQVLQYRALEHWNGRLPMLNGGGNVPLLTFDVSKVGKGEDEDEKRLIELLGEEDAKGDPAAPSASAAPSPPPAPPPPSPTPAPAPSPKP